jgi:hypothetical protein
MLTGRMNKCSSKELFRLNLTLNLYFSLRPYVPTWNPPPGWEPLAYTRKEIASQLLWKYVETSFSSSQTLTGGRFVYVSFKPAFVEVAVSSSHSFVLILALPEGA